MRVFWSFLFIVLLGQPLSGVCAVKKNQEKTAAPSLPSAPGPVYHWTRSSAADGLFLYWSRVEGSQVIAFRGEGIVDCPIEKAASILLDAGRAAEWADKLLDSKILREAAPAEFIEYSRMRVPLSFPLLLWDREFVSRVTLRSDPDTRRLTITCQTAEDEGAPLQPKLVRGAMTRVFRLVPMSLADQTYVEAEIHCDPKGGAAKWLVNFFQQSWPRKTLENLRKQAGKKDIQILPVVTKLLPAHPLHLDPKPDAPVPHPKRGMKRVHR